MIGWLHRTLLIACVFWLGPIGAGLAGPYDIGIVVSNTLYDSPGIPRAEYAERDGDAIEMAFKRVFALDENNISRRRNQTRSNLDALFGPKDHPELGAVWS